MCESGREPCGGTTDPAILSGISCTLEKDGTPKAGQNVPAAVLCAKALGEPGRAVDIGEAEIAALEGVRKPGVVDSHQVQDGGMQIVHVNGILHGA